MSPSLEIGQMKIRAAGDASSSEGMYSIPLVGTVVSIILAIFSLSILSAFFATRFLTIQSWRKLPLVNWVTLAIYVDSWLFVAIATILRWGPGIDTSWDMCSTAIFLCLACYLSTKLLIYFFLVEKAFVVWGGRKSRLQSKLYIFNSFGMLSIFGIIGIFNFIYRITTLENGKCVIGMQRPVLIPLISFDLAVNVYLTILFLIPLRSSYSFNMDKTSGNAKLRDLVVRTFIGAVTSTVTCLLNITIMMALDGEPGWVCLMSCNIDLLFDAVIVQYVTFRDKAGGQTTISDRAGTAVAVERSVVVHHSANRTVVGKDGNIKRSNLADVEEEIGMSKLGAAPAGSHSSVERLKGDFASDRSSESVNEMELGNKTNVVATAKEEEFDWRR